jgi:hypothetical protein
MDILSSKEDEDVKKEHLFKFLEEIDIAKYLRFDEIIAAQEEEKRQKNNKKINNLNKDVIEVANETTVDYTDQNWPTEMMFDWETSVDYTEMIALKEMIDKMDKDGI